MAAESTDGISVNFQLPSTMNRRGRRVSPKCENVPQAPATAKKSTRTIRGRRFLGSTKGSNLSSYATYVCSITFGLWIIASLKFLTAYVGTNRDSTGLRILQETSRSTSHRILSQWASQKFDIRFPLPPKNTILHHPFRPHRLPQFERFVDSKQPDHGGLLLRIFEDMKERGRRREIYHDFELDMGFLDPLASQQETAGDDFHDGYYAFDDDIVRNPALTYDDPIAVAADTKPRCRRTAWHRLLTLNCNTMHEYDVMGRFTTGASKFVGQGSYRSVFLETNDHVERETNVLKTYRFDRDFDYTAFEFMRMDALVAERLTKHPEIMNIYGNCGLAMLHEAAVHGNLEEIALPIGNGRLTAPLQDTDHLSPQNSLAPKLKLEWSLRMAEAVALLHSYPGGVIVHDDIQLPQFLLTAGGSLKLNDFNRAEVMLFDEEKQKYCGYRNNPGGGDWRAPEEYADKPLNEQIDVWSLGNNMYTVLTGLFPFYMIHSFDEIKERVQNGETAFIDPRWKAKSFAEGALARIIPLCWRFDPSERIDIFTLVQLLRQAVKENNEEEKKKKLAKQKKNPDLVLALVRNDHNNTASIQVKQGLGHQGAGKLQGRV